MGTVRIQECPPQSDSFGTKRKSLDDICTGTDTAVNHDVYLVEEVRAEGTDFVQEVDTGRCAMMLAFAYPPFLIRWPVPNMSCHSLVALTAAVI